MKQKKSRYWLSLVILFTTIKDNTILPETLNINSDLKTHRFAKMPLNHRQITRILESSLISMKFPSADYIFQFHLNLSLNERYRIRSNFHSVANTKIRIIRKSWSRIATGKVRVVSIHLHNSYPICRIEADSRLLFISSINSICAEILFADTYFVPPQSPSTIPDPSIKGIEFRLCVLAHPPWSEFQ